MMPAKQSKPKSKTRPLNLRNFPDSLYWKCKIRAAQQRLTLKDFVVTALERATSENMSKSSAA
jgi:hypothetical protein